MMHNINIANLPVIGTNTPFDNNLNAIRKKLLTNYDIYSSPVYPRLLPPDTFLGLPKEGAYSYIPTFDSKGSLNKKYNFLFEIKVIFDGEPNALFLNKQLFTLLSPTIKQSLEMDVDDSGIIHSKLISMETFQVINDLMMIPMNSDLETKIGLYILIEGNMFILLQAIDFLGINHLNTILVTMIMNSLPKYLDILILQMKNIMVATAWPANNDFGNFANIINYDNNYVVDNDGIDILNENEIVNENNAVIDVDLLIFCEEIKFETIEKLLACCTRYKLYEPVDWILREMLDSKNDTCNNGYKINRLGGINDGINVCINKLTIDHFWRFIDSLGETQVDALKHIIKLVLEHNKNKANNGVTDFMKTLSDTMKRIYGIY